MNFKGKAVVKTTTTSAPGLAKPKAIADYMKKDVVCFKPDQDIWDAIHLMLKRRISGGPVVDEAGKLIGILTEKDCLRVLVNAAYNNHPSQKDKVERYMSSRPRALRPEENVLSVAQTFLGTPFRRFPVLDADGVLCGQISRRDLMQAAADLRSTSW